MTIEIRKRDKETVIRVVGVLDDVTVASLEKTIDDRAKRCASIVLDLNNVEEISGTGLRALIKIRERIKEKSSLRLTGVCESVMQVLEASGVNA